MRGALAKKIRKQSKKAVAEKTDENKQQIFNAIMSAPFNIRLKIACKILFKIKEKNKK